ncbi:hypothetical protein SEA27A368_40630 [Salmonella enterica]|nr:hypothetical protein SEA27A368_40630 [Salmonella enterica]
MARFGDVFEAYQQEPDDGEDEHNPVKDEEQLANHRCIGGQRISDNVAEYHHQKLT